MKLSSLVEFTSSNGLQKKDMSDFIAGLVFVRVYSGNQKNPRIIENM